MNRRNNTCAKCQKSFEKYPVIDGKIRDCHERLHCLECVPFGTSICIAKKSWTEKELREAVDKSYSIAETLDNLGDNRFNTSKYLKIKKDFEKYSIDVSHFSSGGARRSYSLDEILVEDSKYSTSSYLKKRIIKENILEKVCSNCKRTEWQKAPIPLEIDHINGVRNDNRLENLRLLCPNCHALTPTYKGKNVKQPKKIKRCRNCNKEISFSSIRCKPCDAKSRKPKNKIDWPPMEQLIQMLKDSNFTQVGKTLGISDNTVRKNLVRNGYSFKTLMKF